MTTVHFYLYFFVIREIILGRVHSPQQGQQTIDAGSLREDCSFLFCFFGELSSCRFRKRFLHVQVR